MAFLFLFQKRVQFFFSSGSVIITIGGGLLYIKTWQLKVVPWLTRDVNEHPPSRVTHVSDFMRLAPLTEFWEISRYLTSIISLHHQST